MWGALTRGRVCRLQLLLVFASAVIFGSDYSVGLVTIFYCLRFETSLFVASYDSHGNGGGIRRRIHTGGLLWLSSEPHPAYILSARTIVETPRFYCYSPALALLVSAGTCLPNRCLEMGLVYPPLSRSLHSNGCFCGSIILALSTYATIC
jgi:hypothetical protein